MAAAYLIHSRPYKENSLLAEFLTQESGRVSAVARKGKQVPAGLLQPFNLVEVTLSGKGELQTLTQIEYHAEATPFSLQQQTLYCGLYMNELLVKLLPKALTCELLFHRYHQSLLALANQQQIELALRLFEVELLSELGVMPDLMAVVTEQQGNFIRYIDQQGFVACVAQQGQRQVFATDDIAAIAQADYSPQVMRTFKLLMRQLINLQLGGKVLNSRRLFQTRD